MRGRIFADQASDIHVFGDANHQLLVVGTEKEGFSLWCRRCDRLGTQIYGSLPVAQQRIDGMKKDIAPECQPVKRSA